MYEYIQPAIVLLGMLTVAKLFIVDFFEIIKLLISKSNGIVTEIKKLKDNIKK